MDAAKRSRSESYCLMPSYFFSIKVVEGRNNISPITRLRQIRKFLKKNKIVFEYVERFYSTVQAWIPENKIYLFEEFASQNKLCWNGHTHKEEPNFWGEKAFSARGLRDVMKSSQKWLEQANISQ